MIFTYLLKRVLLQHLEQIRLSDSDDIRDRHPHRTDCGKPPRHSAGRYVAD